MRISDWSSDVCSSDLHGLEHARPGQSAEAMDRPPAIDFVLEKLRVFASVRPGILVEEKTLGAGLHFRLAPQYEADCLSLCMQLADEPGLYLQRGKMLIELRPGHAGKGRAVTHLVKATELAGGERERREWGT